MKKPYSDRLRKNLLALSRRRNITFEKLAIEADFSKSSISKIMAGQQSISLGALKRIAEALKVDVVDLLKP